MTLSRTQIAKWVERQIGPAYDSPAVASDWPFAERVVQQPNLVRYLSPARADRVVWRFGWMVAWSHFATATERRQASILEVLRHAPKFLRYFEPRLEPKEDAVYMFWDIVLSDRDRAAEPLRATAFDALAQQLTFPNPRLQRSALHGFGHLKDTRSQPLIRKFIDRCPAGDLRDYAEMAHRFEVM